MLMRTVNLDEQTTVEGPDGVSFRLTIHRHKGNRVRFSVEWCPVPFVPGDAACDVEDEENLST